LGFGQLSGLCTAWEFAFSAPEAYLIEDGWLTRTLTGVTLLGNGPATLAWQAVKRQLTSERLYNQALNSGTVEGA
jgi:predicted Zn-dependent protease